VLVTIDLSLKPTDQGGRVGPIFAGYRSMWANGDVSDDGEPLFHDAPIVVLEPDPLEPGASGVAIVQPILPDALGWWHLQVGDEMTMFEGSRHLGTARVTAIDPSTYPPQWP
jgi:hypothetical protein